MEGRDIMSNTDREQIKGVLQGVENRLRRISRKRTTKESKEAYKAAAQKVHSLINRAA
jgi:hypothetical protein